MHKARFYRRISAAVAVLLTGGVMVATTAASSSPGQSPRGPDPTVTVQAGGIRTNATSVGGLGGVTFQFFEGASDSPPIVGTTPVAAMCATTATGSCNVSLASNTDYWVVQTGTPANFTQIKELDVGSGSVSTNYTQLFFHTQTSNITLPPSRNTSGIQTGGTYRSSQWALASTNPTAPHECGLNFALLFDLSGSVRPNLQELKDAGINFVDALEGTPSRVAIYNFAGFAPADDTPENAPLGLTSTATPGGVALLTSKIDGLAIPASNSNTNWDTGLWQIAAVNMAAANANKYNVVIVLTDGVPNRYGPNNSTAGGGGGGGGGSGNTNFYTMEQATFSANAVKTSGPPAPPGSGATPGTRIISVGIGISTAANLQAISGPTEGGPSNPNGDWFLADFAGLGDTLASLARSNCKGTITIVKQLLPPVGVTGEPTPGVDWTFSHTVDFVTPASGTTDSNGATPSFDSSAATGAVPVTFAEHIEDHPGTIFLGSMTRCVDTVTGESVLNSVSQANATFTLTPGPDDIVVCDVFNRSPTPATVTVNKQWVINGKTFANGDLPAFQSQLTLNGLPSVFGVPQSGVDETNFFVGSDVTIGQDNVTEPHGCTVTETTLTPPDVTLPTGGETVTLGAATNTFTMTSTVTCAQTLTLVKDVVNPFPGLPTTQPASAWTLTARLSSTSPPIISGSSPESGVPGPTGQVPSQTPLLLEESSVDGYTQFAFANTPLAAGATGAWDCQNTDPGQPPGIENFDGQFGTVTLTDGADVTCTATNEQNSATLTMVKEVSNGPTGMAVASNWTLTATPNNVFDPALPTVSGPAESAAVTSALIPADQPYTLSESGPDGYNLTDLACETTDGTAVQVSADHVITGATGQNITCTFTNTQVPRLSITLLDKTADPQSFTGAGQDIVFTYTVENTGNIPLNDVTISDTRINGGTPFECVASLAPDAIEMCHATYTTQPGDVQAGHVENVATASALPQGATERITSDSITLDEPLTIVPSSISVLSKTASPTTFTAAGQHITYTYTVKNTGQVALTNVTITDTQINGARPFACVASLAVGATATCSATFTTTAADVRAGAVTNAALAIARPEGAIANVQSVRVTNTIRLAAVPPPVVPVTG